MKSTNVKLICKSWEVTEEAERASACEHPIVWFTLDEPAILNHWPEAESSEWEDGWGSFFGQDGCTKCSYMLTVTHRACDSL